MPAQPSPPPQCVRFLLPIFLVLALASRGQTTTSATVADGFKRYALTGEVISTDQERNTLVVRHDAVPGLMPAMVMEFPVSRGDAAIAKSGSRIRGELVEMKPGGFRLEKIWPDDPLPASRMAAGLNALKEETATRGKSVPRESGDRMPNLPLLDQNGKVFEASAFRGRTILLNFIYSRCPFADMCPAATLKMMATQEAARNAGIKNLLLISITLDPEYDTPGILHSYAKDRGIDSSSFVLLTGPIPSIQNLLKQFAVEAAFEGGALKHSLATVLFDSGGRLIYRASGLQWEPSDFLKRLPRP